MKTRSYYRKFSVSELRAMFGVPKERWLCLKHDLAAGYPVNVIAIAHGVVEDAVLACAAKYNADAWWPGPGWKGRVVWTKANIYSRPPKGDPTPKEIRERVADVQANWTETERAVRGGSYQDTEAGDKKRYAANVEFFRHRMPEFSTLKFRCSAVPYFSRFVP